MSTIINALLPVFITLLIGYLAAWHHDADGKSAGILNKMVMTFTLPLSLFAGTVTTPREQLVSNLPMAGALLAGVVVPFVVVLLAARYLFHRGLGESTLQAVAVSFPAVPFIGIPVLSAIFGAGAATLTVAMGGLITNLIIVPVSIVLLSIAVAGGKGGGGKEGPDTGGAPPPGPGQPAGQPPPDEAAPAPEQSTGSIILSSLAEPVVWAPVLALVVVFIGLQVPAPLVKSLQLLGAATSGVSLFASGVILQAQKPTFSKAIGISTFCRLVAVPGLALLLLPLVGLKGGALRESVVALSMPCAVMLVILSVRYHVAERESASVMLYSYVFSALTMAAAIAITG